MNTVVALIYLLSSIMFILGLKMLTRVKTARRGNMLSSSAMLLAVLATLLDLGEVNYTFIIAGLAIGGAIGALMAIRVQMTEMPEMVALFNGFGGGASALVASSFMFERAFGKEGSLVELLALDTTITLFISILIGAVTLSGSLVAFGKLKGLVSGQPILFPGNNLVNLVLVASILFMVLYLILFATNPNQILLISMMVIAFSGFLGVLLVTPIGGADMPVVISLLNSYSGLAAAATGFVLANNMLIICGALVGASGLILTQIMCKAMNRSLANVLFGGFGVEDTASSGPGKDEAYHSVKSCGAEEAAMIFESARDIIIVPGYGLAVAQAQHVTKELADLLIANGGNVRYAIHPVAGRMPGHMNVLLAESNVPHEQLFDLDHINDDFQNADIALILGANDVVNPAATKDPNSPIAGMPVLKVWDAKTVFVVKRSLSPGFAAIPNDLFNYENNMMLFGDAKKILTELVHELKEITD
ncbi:NAD(P) transhydrogenase subunit beta [Sulfidibacter corallicola]|uniref:NAD(P) transhydrogenase subunit beta n=1 Tax=Sulfidibacter corallicola TaxID=2818388 RepID=A0A8A4TY53_SULCO|nr:NAD(P)(+) transhydrogenase (Re/Si-specific) subunit beta [Sulfidibacter corallicola]QTD53892.1 NAD(P)(+) transhydrogenase (Re/Si-specific) subunit beta [Sulfidibacter corallicola]